MIIMSVDVGDARTGIAAKIINDFNEMLIRKNQIGDFYNANYK